MSLSLSFRLREGQDIAESISFYEEMLLELVDVWLILRVLRLLRAFLSLTFLLSLLLLRVFLLLFMLWRQLLFLSFLLLLLESSFLA